MFATVSSSLTWGFSLSLKPKPPGCPILSQSHRERVGCKPPGVPHVHDSLIANVGVFHARRTSLNCFSRNRPPHHAEGRAITTRAIEYQCGPNAGPLFPVATAPTKLRMNPIPPTINACLIGS